MTQEGERAPLKPSQRATARAKPTRRHLTKTAVDAVKPSPEGRRDVLVWDADKGKSKGVAGFGLQVKPSGHKSYVFQYRNARGQVRRMTLGRHGDLTVQQARQLAADAKHKVRQGLDPLAERQERRRAGSEPRTVAELCDDFLENHAKRVKRSWREDERRLKIVRDKLGRMPLDRVTKTRVRHLVTEIGGGLPGDKGGAPPPPAGKEYRPYEANRVLFLVQTMFNYAIDHGYLPTDFQNPAKWKARERYPEKPRTRILRDDERPLLLEAIESEPNPYHRALFKLLLLTGLRKGEWLGAKWDELDLPARRLTLPRTKSGKERIVPLSSAAVEILRSLPRHVGNDHVFPAQAVDQKTGGVRLKPGNRPMNDPKKQWLRVRTRAGCPDLRVHDLRRTASNVMLRKIGNPKAVQEALGHADLQTTMRHYVLAEEKAQREAAEALAEEVLS